MNYIHPTDIQQENFELILNIDTSRIPSVDLIRFLSNTDLLFKSINQSLNEKYSIGYDDITTDVLALEKGSFKIPIVINKRLIQHIFVGALEAFMGTIAANLLSNCITPYTIKASDQAIEITNEELLENRNTASAVANIAKMAVENEGIRDIHVIYEKENGEQEKVLITKETLSEVAEKPIEQEDNMSNLQTNIPLEIVSPVFVNKPTSWRVLYNGRPINAKMTDQDFLETMDNQRIAFAKGDIINADLESVATNTDKGIKLKHYIRKVHSYPRYTRITRHGKTEQRSLFDEE